MCMTSNSINTGFAAPSNLPYTDDSPIPICQLRSMIIPVRVPATTTPCAKPNVACAKPKVACTKPKVVSACSTPTFPPKKAATQMPSRDRRRMVETLPLPLRKRACQTPEERFAAFVAILLMYLNSGGQPTYKLRIQAKALVTECCRRNQMGDPNFMPLNDSLSLRLHGLVGEAHWNRAIAYLQVYLVRHHNFHLKRDAVREDARLLHFAA